MRLRPLVPRILHHERHLDEGRQGTGADGDASVERAFVRETQRRAEVTGEHVLDVVPERQRQKIRIGATHGFLSIGVDQQPQQAPDLCSDK